MKNLFKGLGLAAVCLAASLMTVDAASINKTSCGTVYTNYYFLLDANTTSYFSNGYLNNVHKTVGEYQNNSYLTTFNSNNVGYGQVNITKSTSTSSDGITSMSLNDYYTYFLNATNRGGAYTSGTKNYISAHSWYRVNSDNSWTQGGEGLNLANYSKNALINATLNANSSITRISPISSNNVNPFQLQITRNYYGYLTNSPITYGNEQWYLHPAVYYVQYCSTKNTNTDTDDKDEYTVTYYPNADNVTNVPSKQYADEDECLKLSTKTPVKDGYTFLGWSTNPDATNGSSAYRPGAQYCGENGNLKLYAIWSKDAVAPSTYKVNYNANTTETVTNMPTNAVVDSNNNYTISSSIPVRNSYTFNGWSTDANASTPNYAIGSIYTEKKDLTLYAIWTKNAGAKNPATPDKPNGGSGTVPNPQTGISDFLLPLGGISASAGAVLTFLKKKNSFRQF